MHLRSITANVTPNFRHWEHGDLHFSNSISFSFSSFRFLHNAISTSHRTCRNLASVTCLSLSKARRYQRIDYERRPGLNWKDICKRVSVSDSSNWGAAAVLDQAESEGERLSKWELCRVVKELRKFRRFKSALEVYEWMNSRAERYIITSSDAAIQLDLIAIVNGVQQAEQYFLKLLDGLKDRRIYGSLLNAYVRSGMRENAESLMMKMRNRGYAAHTLPFNVMMTLYMKLKDHDKIESLVSEMKEKNVALDVCTYNIWLSSCGYQGSIEKMEQVFQQMLLDTTIKPRWTTFSTMATMYIKLGDLEKAEDCLRKLESKMTGRDREPYHYLISLYGGAGKKEEVYRMWNAYKTSFAKIPNLGFQTVISALIKVKDIDSAEKIYDEWLSVKSRYDPRIGNLLLGWYVREGLSDKAEAFFNQMIEVGGEPNSMAWEILSVDHVRNLRIPKAVSCFRNAASAYDSKKWKPKPANVSYLLEICEREDDTASKDALMEVLRQVGCLEDVRYTPFIPKLSDGKITSNVEENSDHDNDYADAILDQLQESL